MCRSLLFVPFQRLLQARKIGLVGISPVHRQLDGAFLRFDGLFSIAGGYLLASVVIIFGKRQMGEMTLVFQRQIQPFLAMP
jgi:hypothetical protein